MTTRLLFKASAIAELLTGLALLVAPLYVIGLLLGEGLGSTGVAVARVLGIGLLSVGVAGWESPGQDARLAPRAALCTYNVGAAVVLLALGAYGGMNGIILWPVAGLHTLVGATMLWVIVAPPRNSERIDGKQERIP